jgi:hypothetical protein
MGARLQYRAALESVALDTTRISQLRRSVGDQRAREIVEEVVFHLTDRIGLLAAALERGDGAEAQAIASRLGLLSEQVGLALFAQVARDLDRCLARGDGPAGAAVAARLARLADESLCTVLRYADQSAL